MNRDVICSSVFNCCCMLGVCGAILLNNPSPAVGLECLNHPDAIGTARTIVVDPKQTPRVGDLIGLPANPVRPNRSNIERPMVKKR